MLDPSSTPSPPPAGRRAAWPAVRPLAPGALAVAAMLLTALAHPPAAPALVAASAAVAVLMAVLRPRHARTSPDGGNGAEDGRTATSPDGAERLAGEVLQVLPDPLLVVRGDDLGDMGDRLIVRANTAAEALLKLSPEPEGRPLYAAVRDPDLLEAVDEALFGGVARSIEHRTGGAQERIWNAWVAPLPGGDGEADRLAVVRLRDDTDARRAEMTRVDFLANASHELRTPLASLVGFIETLRGPARDDAEAREKFLGIMAVQADRMARLVADLLSLSRIELNEHIPPSGRVDLAGAVSDVVDATQPLAARRGVRLSVTREDGGPADVTGDRDQIIQVIQNLTDNAVKYSPDGGTVEISVASDLGTDEAARMRMPEAAGLSLLTPDRDSEARYARIEVRDHGPGLRRETMPRLTERFYRVEGQKSGERLGTGLGLAIVKHIVNRHRGGMTVESRPGEGTRFGVYLPLAPRETGRDLRQA